MQTVHQSGAEFAELVGQSKKPVVVIEWIEPLHALDPHPHPP
jgi:hypothetical protein